MYCRTCGKQITDNSRFCTICGAANLPPTPRQPVRRPQPQPVYPVYPQQGYPQPVYPYPQPVYPQPVYPVYPQQGYPVYPQPLPVAPPSAAPSFQSPIAPDEQT